MESNSINQRRATLALADGYITQGISIGADGTTIAEAVLNTAMTGYQEILSDPSYKGQFLVFTAPHIGNVGINDYDFEADGFNAAGLIIRQISRKVSNHRANKSLQEALRNAGIVGISDVDTRAIVRRIRDFGAMNAIISTEIHDGDKLLSLLQDAPSMEGQNLVAANGKRETLTPLGSSTKNEPLAVGVDGSNGETSATIPDHAFRVALIDFGAKGSIETLLRVAGCEVEVLPADVKAEELTGGSYDGVMLSNGPGDPAAMPDEIGLVQELLDANLPLFGICLGHQLLGLAIGAKTFKMHHGHHGANHPVRNLVADRLDEMKDAGIWLPLLARENIAVEITSQNHGFAVDADTIKDGEYGRVIASHINLTDGSNAGLALIDRPAFSVQYHPESAPGPHDSRYLFDQFVALMAKNRELAGA